MVRAVSVHEVVLVSVVALTSSACTAVRAPAAPEERPPPRAADPSTPATRAIAPSGPAQERPPRYVGRHRLVYAATIESSCSESWDVTTWSGEVALDLVDGGAARIELRVGSQSQGGAQPPAPADPSSHSRPETTCGLIGTWALDEPGITAVFPRQAGDAATSECRPAIGALDTPAEQAWVLRCTHQVVTLPDGSRSGPPRREGVLGCATSGGTPWIWNLVLEGGRELHLGDARPVFAEAQHGDELLGEILLPDGTVSEPEPGPTEWLAERPTPL